ncbi:hypothetical protein J7E70_26050 [Variovorax paradoxus]|nr:hypothetical protein [Variovorax paradoxus]MBT2303910.1 hypothetical protein [Variovorax paradoxus]
MERFMFCVVATLMSASVIAQANPFNGTWLATFKTERGIDRDGTVVVENDGGSWDMNVPSRNNPCFGRKAPIEIQKATPEELVFVVARSKALTGCNDTRMVMKVIDAKTLKGTFNGSEFTLTKKD